MEQRKRLWFAAVKPPMYTVALIPVLVGSALAFSMSGHFTASHFWKVIFASINIIAWLNVSNDVFDHDKDTDKGKAESVVNLTGSRTKCFVASLVFFVIGVGMFFQLTSAAADDRIVKLLSTAIAMGYIYQGPPFRLSYKGLGEPLCFVAFGPLSTTAFYLAQYYCSVGRLAAVTPAVGFAAVAVGITTAIILFCSHFHQIEGDRAAGKISPLVRLGPTQGLQVLRAACFSVYGLAALGIGLGALPPTCVLVLLSLPMLKVFLKFAQETHLVPAQVWPLKRYAIKWHTLFGLTLALGLAAPNWLGLSL
ncbi:hypothetical protein WJX74_001418 [Apatococcus lobatus]|uniref:1,4-dihydroxy-2-naphthoate octaprenyltransferase n=2 Tax=Apatococcus TaxID=904362 RepID=A0AAW1SZP8_9CHLO